MFSKSFIEAHDDITYEVLEAFGFQGSSIDFDAFLKIQTEKARMKIFKKKCGTLLCSTPLSCPIAHSENLLIPSRL